MNGSIEEDFEIDFNLVPITILTVNDFEKLTNLELRDGIYYATKIEDENIKEDIKQQIINILDCCVNKEKRTLVGVKLNLDYQSLNEFFRYTAYERDCLLNRGINPLVDKINGIYTWGQYFVFRGIPHHIISSILTSENNIITFIEYVTKINAIKKRNKLKEDVNIITTFLI